ncbi:MAG: DUF2252 family protein [Thermoguttaceae bacterium]|jgi:hypothetical protein
MDITQATQGYEAWLEKRIALIPADLKLKHQRMAEGVFPFLRATFYRWVQRWAEVCPELAAAPTVLSVGDLHIENFGTWRDAEGRLIWGINDFDEACPMPYTNDLLRLAASAILAIRENHLSLDPQDACDALLAGYRATLDQGGCPFVLTHRHRWLRDLAQNNLRDPVAFWDKLDKLPATKEPIVPEVIAALERWLPEKGLSCKLVHRIAGLGSLGRQRFVALADWRGGLIAREAKALAVSACLWEKQAGGGEILYQKILDTAVRVLDPWVQLSGSWIIRRLAPDCSRVELAALPKDRDEQKLLQAMGQETANVQAGEARAKAAIRADFQARHSHWLRKAAEAMADATEEDWKQWRKT